MQAWSVLASKDVLVEDLKLQAPRRLTKRPKLLNINCKIRCRMYVQPQLSVKIHQERQKSCMWFNLRLQLLRQINKNDQPKLKTEKIHPVLCTIPKNVCKCIFFSKLKVRKKIRFDEFFNRKFLHYPWPHLLWICYYYYSLLSTLPIFVLWWWWTKHQKPLNMFYYYEKKIT